ncbi:pyridoxal-phosphate dependent enzyme, partial [[Kitasatospora] papulosa]
MITVADVEAAAKQITGHVLRTPTVPSPGLSAFLGVRVTAKLELLQRTGSFKARGATAKLLALSEAERAAGVVAVSGGNHGIGVAVMAGVLGVE